MATRSAVCAVASVRCSPRAVDAMERAAYFHAGNFIDNGASVRRDTGNAPATAPIGSRRMAAINPRAAVLMSLETGFENHETFTRAFAPDLASRHPLQESRKDTATINPRCTFHRASHSSCLRKHLTRRSRPPRTASVWKSQNHKSLSGKRSPATSIPGGRKISTSRNHRNASSLR